MENNQSDPFIVECKNVKISKNDKELSPSKNDESDGLCKRYTFTRKLITLALAAGFFVTGLDLTILGLALPTLAENMKKTTAEVAPAIIARGAGYLIGSIISGLSERRIDIQITITISLVFMSVGLFFTPVILSPIGLYISSFITALGLGAFETVGNVLCLQLWASKSDPILQFLHFCFCFGCAITPIIAKPFLNEVYERNHTLVNETVYRDVILIEGTSLPYLSIFYMIVTCCGVIVSLCFLCLKICTPNLSASSQSRNDKLNQENSTFRYGVLFMLFMFYFLYLGLTISFLTFLYTFAVSNTPGANYTKDQASYLNTAFLASVAVGQFCAVFLSRKFAPEKILWFDISLLSASLFVILLLPFYAQHQYIFWIFVSTLGFAASSIYGSTYLWAEKHITVNGSAASIFVVGGSLGEMVLPIPVGQLIESNPMSFLYFMMGYAVLFVILFLIMVKIGSFKSQIIKRLENRKTTNLELNVCDSK